MTIWVLLWHWHWRTASGSEKNTALARWASSFLRNDWPIFDWYAQYGGWIEILRFDRNLALACSTTGGRALQCIVCVFMVPCTSRVRFASFAQQHLSGSTPHNRIEEPNSHRFAFLWTTLVFLTTRLAFHCSSREMLLSENTQRSLSTS